MQYNRIPALIPGRRALVICTGFVGTRFLDVIRTHIVLRYRTRISPCSERRLKIRCLRIFYSEDSYHCVMYTY